MYTNQIRSFLYSGLICMAALVLPAITSCNSSESDSEAIEYTGITTQAVIDNNNAEDVLMGPMIGGELNTGMSAFGAIDANSMSGKGSLPVIKILTTLGRSLNNLDYTFDHEDLPAASSAIAAYTDIDYGDCGGSLSYNLQMDDQTYAFTGYFSANSFCNDDMTISGEMTALGQFNAATQGFTSLTMTYDALSFIEDDTSMTFDGTVVIVPSGTVLTITLDAKMKDNNTGEVYWYENFVLTYTEATTYDQFSISGRFFEPNHGYVNLNTTTAFITNTDEDYPSQGVLVTTGAAGSEGGSTKAMLTALSSSTYNVQADTNGDGTYDYDSGVLNWADSEL